MNEIIVFTHTDADALSCMINLNFALPKEKKVYFHTNYMNIKEKTNEILDYYNKHKNEKLYILDISFSDNKESLLELIKTGIDIQFIDHHLYPDGFFEEMSKFPNFKYLHKIDYSAGLLTYAFFGNNGKNNNLDYLTKLIDKYDIWRKDSEGFYEAKLFNEYFFRNSATMSIENLMYKFIDNDYNFPKDYENTINIIKKEIQETRESLEKRKLIHRTKDICIIFSDKYFNFIIADEFKDGRQCCIIVNDWGIVRIRISENSVLTSEQKDEIRLKFIGNKDVGHQNAFTYRVKNVSFENIMSEIKSLSSYIQGEIKKRDNL